jgi:hypothetical protein
MNLIKRMWNEKPLASILFVGFIIRLISAIFSTSPDSAVRTADIYIAGKFAFMYDGDKETWLVRESGIVVGVPELAGHIFIGRTKEGYSMVKVMNGHSPWTAERQMALDVIPILADGIKYL